LSVVVVLVPGTVLPSDVMITFTVALVVPETSTVVALGDAAAPIESTRTSVISNRRSATCSGVVVLDTAVRQHGTSCSPVDNGEASTSPLQSDGIVQDATVVLVSLADKEENDIDALR
jgi:hypothetical protein